MTVLAKLQHSLALVALFGLFGCGSDSSPVGPTSTAPVATTAAVLTTMERALQDEFRAEAIYQGVLDDHGDVIPFSNVLFAEQRHSASIAQLFGNRGVAVPASAWSVANVPHFESVQAACAAGVDAEIDNIELYDDLMGAALPADVERVFTNNRLASLDKHLPAFELCR